MLYTITRDCIADARLYGSTWSGTGPDGRHCVSCGKNESGAQHYGWFRFEAMNIPAYAVIVSAHFCGVLYGDLSNSGKAHSLCAVKGGLFTESARNGASRDTTATGSVTLYAAGSAFRANVTAIVQAWHAGTCTEEYGICITSSAASSYKQIRDRAYGGAANMPRLEIVYEIPASQFTTDRESYLLSEGVNLSITAADAGNTHRLYYIIDGVETPIAELAAGVASYTWTPGAAAGAKFPSAASAACTLRLETYLNGTPQGDAAKDITLTAPNVAPTVATPATAISPLGDTTIPDVYVQGKSKCAITVSASGNYGAGIASCVVTCDGIVYNGTSVVSNLLMNTGAAAISATVTDTRGRSTTRSTTVTVLAYAPPQLSLFTAARCAAAGMTDDTGGFGKCAITGSASPVGGRNTLSCVLQIRAVGAGAWTSLTAPAISNLAISQAAFLLKTASGNFALDTATRYDLKIALADRYTAIARTIRIGNIVMPLYVPPSGKGLGVGVKCGENQFKVSDDYTVSLPGGFRLPVVNGGTGAASAAGAVAALKGALVDLIYPVGSLYLSVNSTSPALLFDGVWERIEDAFLLAAGAAYAAGTSGGEAEHLLTVDEIPSHAHVIPHNQTGGSGSSRWVIASGGTQGSTATRAAGGGLPHNNLPPYLAVYVWKRAA